jgi:hypothetical protein
VTTVPDPTTDFGVFDHQQLVDWVAGSGTVNGIRAVRRPLTQSTGRRIEQFVTLEATDVVFHLEAAPLVGVELQAGDELQTSAASYSVVFVERQSFDTTILAVCRPV